MPAPNLPTIIIIVGFIALIIGSIISYQKASKQFTKEILEQYPPKETFGNAHVTEKGELLFYWPAQSIPGYKKWNLSDIAYIGTYFSGEFFFVDKDGKAMCGEFLVPSKYEKRHLQGRKNTTIYVGGKLSGMVAFVKKHGPHIRHTIDGKVVD